MHRVAVLTFDGVHSFDLAMPLQVFSTAHGAAKEPGELFGPRLYDVRVCADGEDLAVTGVGGVEMYRYTPPYPLAAAIDADTIVVLGTDRRGDPPAAVLELLREAHRRQIRIASICSGGARVLAASGLLDGRRTATHWSRAEQLAQRFPRVTVDANVLFIDHGDVLTSAGAASGIDLCLRMIHHDFGSAVAADVARHMVVPPQREGGQAPYIAHPEPGSDHGVLEPTMRWLRERLDKPVTLAQIADHAGTSPRTVNRRFKEQTGSTPLQWLLRQRVHHAQELLETTDLPIETIATHCGFGTALAMRQHFAKHIDTSPTAYRHAFRGRPVS
ncbi:GlxA family transcriptional regulator [Microlunatus soli]|uniref:Transcriptional regulator GlxA family, contains an amidase domain and an AraC-type DNA-binding HTH domain n=1 Tax=Microlunatus soli TaxID=630515 RepID=A0A1H1MKQ0_9ACTN|nr:helix-turn-helix domain-containing protein [Microlunatus soli]SDR86529.1 Transcriptional regulator GlxA family, contains an amidase domain and an AraC-type DNA-binding HTH domain [Microlunatus soli]